MELSSKTALFPPLISLLYLFVVCNSQLVYPKVNCPDIFQYGFNRNAGGYYGLLTIAKDGSSTYEVQVNMSVKTQTPVNSNIKLVVLSTQDEIFFGNIIKYIVRFPIQNVIPKLTLIQFNGRELCRGQPDLLEPGLIQTSMWAKSIITTFTESLQPQPIPEKPSNSINNPSFFFNIGAQPNNIFPGLQNPFIPSVSDKREPQPIPPVTQEITTPPSTTPKTAKKPQKCGMTISGVNLIIGGEGIGPGDFPWLVAIMRFQNSDYKFHCTGNLLSDRHVLTAGHCVRYYNAPLYDNDELIVVLGKINIENWASGGALKNPKTIIAHRNYKQNNPDYDVALIVLNEAVTFRPTIRPICLWDGADDLADIVGRVGTVVGWSKSADSEMSTIAEKIEMPVVSQETCLRSNKVFKKYTSTRTFCAGHRDNKRGPCIGDSGAGFMIQDPSTRQWYLRGLVGFSIRDPETLTCDLSNYAVFMDVAKIRPWILEEMAKNV